MGACPPSLSPSFPSANNTTKPHIRIITSPADNDRAAAQKKRERERLVFPPHSLYYHRCIIHLYIHVFAILQAATAAQSAKIHIS